MMPGSLSIAKNPTRWTRTDADAYLTCIAVGILAGIAAAFIRTPLHLPGHKALFWITPALAFRLRTRARLGATLSSTATILTTCLLGGNLGGGWSLLPLISLAGLLLDLSANFAEQKHLSLKLALHLFAAAGLLANTLVFLKHLTDPHTTPLSLETMWLSHALFGLLAAALATLTTLSKRKTPTEAQA